MSLLPDRPHAWGGAYGVPGGTERWEHRSYRWHRLLEAALVVAVSFWAAPWIWTALADVVVLTACGLFMWAITRPRRRGRGLRHPLIDGLLVGWLLGRRRR